MSSYKYNKLKSKLIEITSYDESKNLQYILLQ